MSTSPVEHVQVEAGEHAFSWASCRERATSAHHHVEHRKRDEVILLKRKKCNVSCELAVREDKLGSRRTLSADTNQEGAALQANHDVGEFWDRGGTKAHVRHVLLHLEKHMDADFICRFCMSVYIHTHVYIYIYSNR